MRWNEIPKLIYLIARMTMMMLRMLPLVPVLALFVATSIPNVLPLHPAALYLLVALVVVSLFSQAQLSPIPTQIHPTHGVLLAKYPNFPKHLRREKCIGYFLPALA